MRIVGKTHYLRHRWWLHNWPKQKSLRIPKPSLKARLKVDSLYSHMNRRNALARVWRLHNRHNYPWGGSVFDGELSKREIRLYFR